ncbi:preprotein translocase subunit SecG [Lactovum miscens]|uniref:Protein-export membrane protein SecG n=1 Tax=Lactovum miscens TaxID=190387 RepID=A0A841C5J0_9LACT|nr:preprotein translocase subunit SecG [Lactovum miscens]MBB5887537.1 preprotein translocase subunit SecG [Lactovum miscens]
MQKSIYNALLVVLLVLSFIIVIAILLQPSRQDGTAGLFSGSTGSDDLFERHKARGFEAIMQRFTATMIALWMLIGFALVVLSSN